MRPMIVFTVVRSLVSPCFPAVSVILLLMAANLWRSLARCRCRGCARVSRLRAPHTCAVIALTLSRFHTAFDVMTRFYLCLATCHFVVLRPCSATRFVSIAHWAGTESGKKCPSSSSLNPSPSNHRRFCHWGGLGAFVARESLED